MKAKQVSGFSKKQFPKCVQVWFVEVKFSVLYSKTQSLLLVGAVLTA
jgi:hypothetical protein